MVELTKAGLYIAQGATTNVLIRVVGTAPMLNIVSGVLLNKMASSSGEVVVLGPNDPEIQDIICNPNDYIYELPSISESIEKSGFEKEVNKNVEYSDKQFNEWVGTYKEYLSLYKDNWEPKFTIYLLKNTRYSKSQVGTILKEIIRRTKMAQ
jgi:hypothetical protein